MNVIEKVLTTQQEDNHGLIILENIVQLLRTTLVNLLNFYRIYVVFSK